jgi:hypothetical protein
VVFGGGGEDLDSMIRGGEGIGSGREHGSSGGLLCGGDQVRLWGCHWGLTATDHRGGGVGVRQFDRWWVTR